MVNRRLFLKASGALALGSLLLPGCSVGRTAKTSAKLPAPGLQLYTVRDLLEKDLTGTLKKIADIGYVNLEAASGSKGHYYGIKPKEFASMLEGMGMKLRSSHVLAGGQTPEELTLPPTMQTLNNNLQQLVDMAAEAGQSYLICAYLFPSEHKTLDQYKKNAELFNKAGEACKKAGITFAYHNHDFEFETIDGQIPYDLLLSQTDKELVKMELDLYWATKSGNDPVGLFEKHPGRFPLWHTKDMDKTEKKFFTEVGNGSIDFKRIFEKAQTAGMQYYFVEQDQTPGNPIDSVTTSFQNITKIASTL